MPVPTKKLNISTVVYSFYTYMGLKVIHDETKNTYEMKHIAFDKKFNMLSPLIEKWIDDLALSIRDYLAIISFGEARHAWKYADAQIEEIVNLKARLLAYRIGSLFSPKNSLPKLHKLFSQYKWNHSFGGANWANIVEASMCYNTMPTSSVFIDHAIDISHNGGFCFDKGILFKNDLGVYSSRILTHKNNDFIWNYSKKALSSSYNAEIHPCFNIYLNSDVYDLFSYAVKLDLIKKGEHIPPYFKSFPREHIQPPKIKWGPLIVSNPRNDLTHKFVSYKEYIEALKNLIKANKGKKEVKVNVEKEKEKENPIYEKEPTTGRHSLLL